MVMAMVIRWYFCHGIPPVHGTHPIYDDDWRWIIIIITGGRDIMPPMPEFSFEFQYNAVSICHSVLLIYSEGSGCCSGLFDWLFVVRGPIRCQQGHACDSGVP